MRAMKDSGIQWIGEIPTHWFTARLKYILSEPMKYGASESGVDYDEKLPRYIRITDISSDGRLKENGKLSLSESQAKGYILKDNTVLFARSGGTVGKSFIYRKSCGRAAFAGYLISANVNEEISTAKWLKYYTESHGYWEWVNRVFSQATIQNIGADKYSNMPIPIASLSEQHSITTFLNRKCAEIDALTADIETQIETLEQYKRSVITEAVTKGLNLDAEMKDSGAGWLGTVPTTWKTDKLKYHLHRNEPRNPGDKVVLSLYRELGIIPKDSRDDNHNVTSENTSNYKYVRPGDFVINKMKAWQGSVAVSDYEGIVSPAYFVYNFTDNAFYKRYFHYLLRGCYKDEFMRLSGGIRVGQWDLPSSGLDNTIVLIPPIDEQHAIADYLDRKCAEIDSLIADKRTQLDTLAEYKKSLIYEYVTGKKEVPVL